MEEERKRDLDLGNGNVHKHVVMEESFVVTDLSLLWCFARHGNKDGEIV
jgi:hypothetical protein